MGKQTPVVEWTVAKDDAEWEDLCAPLPPDASPVANRRLSLPHAVWSMAALLLLLASAGGRWWFRSQVGLHQAAELRTTAQKELEAEVQADSSFVIAGTGDSETAVDDLRTAMQFHGLEGLRDLTLETVDIQGDQAVVRVATDVRHGASAHRQTRFFRRTGEGWQRTPPDAALWGPVRHLETPSLVFHFRQNDAQAVIAVASQVESLYATMRRNVGLPVTSGAEKLVIEVRVTQPPGRPASQFGMHDPMIVPSPAVYWAPVELTGAELLVQSIVLPLLARVLTQASEQHQIDAAWQPLLRGLRLWQLWDLDLPLAAWREDVVRWAFLDLPASSPEKTIFLPDNYKKLCEMHTLWMQSPVLVGIPLVCRDLDQEAWLFPLWYPRHPLTRLDQLAFPTSPSVSQAPPGVISQGHYPGQTVALATLIEYAVAAYGRERLPALVAGLGQYERWETLLQAAYNVSPAEFEAGWQAYLAANYGI